MVLRYKYTAVQAVACLLIVISPEFVKAQSITTYTLCQDRDATVIPTTNGIVEHSQQRSYGNCSLMIKGLGSHVTLPGISADFVAGCEPIIYLNAKPSCVVNNSFPLTVAVGSAGLLIDVQANSTSFAFEFYGNVVQCGSEIILSKDPKPDEISGIIASDFTSSLSTRISCYTTIRNLPSRSVRFDILHESTLDPNSKNYFEIDNIRLSTTVKVVESNLNNLTRVDFRSVGEQQRFYVKFSVMMCGDPPAIPNARSSRNRLPWYPNSEASYGCNIEYRLKNKSLAVTKCKVVGTEAIWSDLSGIKCIPVPTCLRPPPTMPHALPKSGVRNYTTRIRTYECLEGYHPLGSQTISICESIDPDNIPWTWSPVAPDCTKVECVVKPGFMNTSRGEITATDNKDGRYFYQDYLEFKCFRPQYKKYISYPIVLCLADGNWATSPLCTEIKPYCKIPESVENCDTIGEAFDLSITYSCHVGYAKVSGDSELKCQWKDRKATWIGQLPTCKPHIKREAFIGATVALGIACLGLLIGLIVVIVKYRTNTGSQPMRGDNLPVGRTNLAAVLPTEPVIFSKIAAGETAYEEPIKTIARRADEQNNTVLNNYGAEPASETNVMVRGGARVSGKGRAAGGGDRKAVQLYSNVSPHEGHMDVNNDNEERIYDNVP